MRIHDFIFGALTFLALFLGSCNKEEPTSTKELATIKFPDTRAGRKMSAYLDAINSGKTEVIYRFITENFASSALENFPAKARAAACAKIYMNNHHLEPVGIEKSSEEEIGILTYAKLTKSWLSIRLKLEADKPYRIIDEMIHFCQPPMKIDAKVRAEVINNLIIKLNEYYIFAETAQKMSVDLLNRLKNGEYDTVTEANAFAMKLTDDLRLICKDKHLHIDYFAKSPIIVGKKELTQEEKAKNLLFDKHFNFDFWKVERMGGNIGYIDLCGFDDAESGKETVAAAMTFISNTDALIFDLRHNGGGKPPMVALITSYLFGEKPVHLNDLYSRKENKTEAFWTTPNVAGKKFDKKPVYILTSANTFSAAEEFCYNLKHLKRAIIVGQTTRGGAHPICWQRLSEHFSATIPEKRTINPITKTSWEGTGVEPDVKVPAEQALKTAYIMALTASLKTTREEYFKEEIKRAINQAKFELDEIKRKASS